MRHGWSFSGVVAAGVLCSCSPGAVGHKAAEAWTVSRKAEVSIGAVEGDSVFLFQRITDARMTADGSVVVADGGQSVIRVFDQDGKFLAQMGREGQGPGEFSRLKTIWVVPPDTIGAWDPGNARVTYFTMDGRLTRSAQLSPPLGSAKAGTPDVFVAEFGDGSFAVGIYRAGGIKVGPGTPDSISIEQFGLDGAFQRHIGEVDGLTRFGRTPIPFSPHPDFAQHGDSVYFTDGMAGRVEVWSSERSGARTMELPIEAPEMEGAWKQLESTLQAQDASMWLGLLPDMPREEPIPSILGLLVDSAGRLWTKKYDPATDALWLSGGRARGGEWSVMSPGGTPVATVQVPHGLALLQVTGDRMLTLSADTLGVERVEVHMIHAGA